MWIIFVNSDYILKQNDIKVINTITNTMTYLFTILPLQTSQGDDSGLIFFALIVFPIWAYFIIYKPIKNKIEDVLHNTC